MDQRRGSPAAREEAVETARARGARGAGAPAAAELEALLDLRPERPLRRMPGRETFAWSQVPGRLVVVKRARGGLPGERWYERLRVRAARSPGRREYESLAALAAAGFPVPSPLAWLEERAPARARRSLVVLEHVDHAEDLRALLERRPAAAERWLVPLAELVARLHDAGWYHRDLYLQHFLMSHAGAGVVLIDLGRARRERAPRARWFEKDLAALLHSTPAGVPPRLRLRFLARYLRQRGLRGRARLYRWARRVEARRARMARHLPRFGEGAAP